MAEPEELLVDAARHTTVFLRDLWRRHCGPDPEAPVSLPALAVRLDLFLTAVAGKSFPLRIAQPPARPTVLARLFRRESFPRHREALPATDGGTIWLPPHLGSVDVRETLELYRAMALQQWRRAVRGGAAQLSVEPDPLVRDAALLFEARAAEAEVARLLPGSVRSLARLRRTALARRPPLSRFAPARRLLERLLLQMLDDDDAIAAPAESASPQESLALARRTVESWCLAPVARLHVGPTPLFRDWWVGELRLDHSTETTRQPIIEENESDDKSLRSARLQRRPEPRPASEEEDQPGSAGAWMVQQDSPHEAAEDPFGMERPVDRDSETSAEDFGDMLSELSCARMVSTPGRAREVLLSDDPPPSSVVVDFSARGLEEGKLRYPEWDYATRSYPEPGSTVHVLPAPRGSQAWVDATLARHRTLIDSVRRQFEALRAEPVRLRRQREGEDIDLDACVESHADLRAGGALSEALYESRRPGRRNVAILLLVDASGSTDGWIGAQRRIIDVEKEALLLVSLALQGLAEPYALMAFSGEGPHGVTVRPLKSFAQAFGQEAALHIAGLEPERYTRAGAAIRHGSAQLMREPAAHRLLLLLSDGKPNDADHYDGRYGVEDMRQSVTEARLQGVFPFCLTIDRQAPAYLPRVFGSSGYALLPAPERLPLVLLEWMRRLIAR